MVQGGRVGGGKKFRDSSAVFPSNVERGEPAAPVVGRGEGEEKTLQQN